MHQGRHACPDAKRAGFSRKDRTREWGRLSGTCGNKVSVRKEPLESAALASLRQHLLTDEHARVYLQEFQLEMKRLSAERSNDNENIATRLKQVQRELDNLVRNMLAGVLSPTLTQLLGEREAEKADLEAKLAGAPVAELPVHMPSADELMKRFQEKIADLYRNLNQDEHRTEAATIIARLIERVTIHPDGERGPEAEVEASTGTLLRFATNDNAAPRGGVSSSTAVVAGTHNQRCLQSSSSAFSALIECQIPKLAA
ncbi:MAG: hypothetical protein P0Y64_18060 [Candidatus Sphingomonas colombiensis]|nr:hypothetical protein [Sphingomonas sp.]WEK43202.1 MAG: hypothetical protein P0Y64_18060 [Sphingomonas sp.]